MIRILFCESCELVMWNYGATRHQAVVIQISKLMPCRSFFFLIQLACWRWFPRLHLFLTAACWKRFRDPDLMVTDIEHVAKENMKVGAIVGIPVTDSGTHHHAVTSFSATIQT